MRYIIIIMIRYNDSYIKQRNAFPLATYSCKYVNNFNRENVAIHYHRDFEILYVDKGFADFQISGKGYSVGSGTMILINPFEPHCIEIKSPNYAHRCICFDIGLVELPEKDKLLSGELGYKNIIVNTETLLPYFDMCYNAEKEKAKGWELRARGTLMLLFSLLNDCIGKSNSAKEQAFAKEIMQFLEENYQKDVTSSLLADKFSYNHSYFCRLFKKIFTCSFSEYLNVFRVTKAKELLITHSVSESAVLSGFASLSYFSRTFKSITGVSPAKYKAQIKAL